MMPNVTHGARMSGLLSYLVDTDAERTHNVHAEPHLVAGDAAIMAWHDDAELSASDAAQIAKQLDVPRRAHGIEVPGGDVWHCSLSLRAEEGQLSDEQWGRIAQEFMDRMDFTDAGGKSPARWVAVRHGLSKNGNDHIHIAASRVREDGTKVSIHNDFIRAQRIARELEQEHGLEPLEGEQTRTAARGYQRAEVELATKRGQAEPARVTLEREVRAASIASVDEAEFVRRMRAADVLVRPRYASDRTDVVAGYSVALRPQQGSGEGPVWYGGGRLARDLTLPALRQSWPDTPEAAGAAVAEWNAANRHRRVAAPGRERQALDVKRWDAATQRLQLMNDRLGQIPVQDRGRWAELARDGAGTLAAWSRTAPKEMRPQLAQAASVLGRSAQLRQAPRRRVQSESPFAGAALVLAAATRGPQSRAAELAMMQQMIMFARAIVQMHRAMRDMRTATALQDGVASRLQAIYEQQPRPVAVAAGTSRGGPQDAPREVPEHIRQAREGLAAPTRIRSPLPAKITPRPDVDELQRRRPDKTNAPER